MITKKIEKLKVNKYVTVVERDNRLQIEIDRQKLEEETKLDGCYVIKTDLSDKKIDKETVHKCYKNLALVEQAFRTSKTAFLELRPVHVRLETRTRGHVFIVMLAYRIIKELKDKYRK